MNKIIMLKWFSTFIIVVHTIIFPLNTTYISGDFMDSYLNEGILNFFMNYK